MVREPRTRRTTCVMRGVLVRVRPMPPFRNPIHWPGYRSLCITVPASPTPHFRNPIHWPGYTSLSSALHSRHFTLECRMWTTKTKATMEVKQHVLTASQTACRGRMTRDVAARREVATYLH
eukprot:5985172-Pyramimonas_sp.AAC.1